MTEEPPHTIALELAALEARTLSVQLEHFKIPPEERGRVFYALELMGEAGELLNDCKKYIRTKLTHRRESQSNSRIPEEAADTLVALMLYKLATGTQETIRVEEKTSTPADIVQLHECLSEIACHAAAFYKAETESLRGAIPPDFDADRYAVMIQAVCRVARYFNFDIAASVHDKLSTIITKVQQGYYD